MFKKKNVHETKIFIFFSIYISKNNTLISIYIVCYLLSHFRTVGFTTERKREQLNQALSKHAMHHIVPIIQLEWTS